MVYGPEELGHVVDVPRSVDGRVIVLAGML